MVASKSTASCTTDSLCVGEKVGDNGIHRQREEGVGGSRCDLPTTQICSAASTSVVNTTTPSRANWKSWCHNWNPLKWGYIHKPPEERVVSSECRAGLLSKLTFHWMTPLMVIGYNRQLEYNDIWMVNPDRGVTTLTNLVKIRFRRCIDEGQTNPLLRSLYETFRFEIWLSGICALAGTVLRVVSAFVLRSLIQFVTHAYKADGMGTPTPPIRHGIGLVIGITIMLAAQSLFLNHFMYRSQLIGGQSRGVLIGMIYEKAMSISNKAKSGSKDKFTPSESKKKQMKMGKLDVKEGHKRSQEKQDKQKKDDNVWTNSSIINLMSVHTIRIEKATSLFHIIWTSPIACLITLAFVVINLSYCGLPGFGLLVTGLPASTMAIRSLIQRRKSINKITDQRLSLIHEVLYSIRIIKHFCWENSFVSFLKELRSKEIGAIRIVLTIRNVINATNIVLPPFASILSLIAYALSGHDLAPARVFSTVALFNGLRGPLNLFPLVLGQIGDAWTSLKLIEEFLLEEEEGEHPITKSNSKTIINIHCGSFTWERDTTRESTVEVSSKRSKPQTTIPRQGPSNRDTTTALLEPFMLRDLNFSARRGELIAVIGTVGSGKSSLLASLAAQMRRTSGDITLAGSIAFCPQDPWIQNTTVQNNITFGKELNKGKYEEVIEACALKADLDLLPRGDQTEIGERGITISGGQKQRLGIARAIYFDADIVLLDDPLSAVDIHVSRHIFHHAIAGLLKDKCRVLATHHIWILNQCDRIIWMENGRIHANDTYDNLMHHDKGFQNLMQSTPLGEEKHDKRKSIALTMANVERDSNRSFKKSRIVMRGENQPRSSITWPAYKEYIHSSGSILNAPLVFFILLLSQGANIMTGLWLSYWTTDKFGLSIGQYVGVYSGLGAVQGIFVLIYSVLVSILGINASKSMLYSALDGVLRAPMSFFDTTPLGSIMSRFASDVDVVDNQLANAIRIYLFSIATIGSVFVLIIAFFPYFTIALVVLTLLFTGTLLYYRTSAREIKRLEAALRSRMFARFSEGLSGVMVIRSYKLKHQFINDLRNSIDEINGAYFLSFSSQRWLAIRLDMIGNALVCVVGALVVTSRFNVNPSIGGLVLSYVMAIVQMLQMTTRQQTDVENGMDSVERLYNYGRQLEQEAPLRTVEMRRTWPEKGEIIFDSIKMQYHKNSPFVLYGLSLHIHGGERMAIVGRTGAGKSSIMNALFRIVEIAAGSITIDGVDISTIGLWDLRSSLVIIPQEPGLFRGTLRTNLDPSNHYTDDELWSALRQIGLVTAEASSGNPQTADTYHGISFHLDTVVDQDGANFSFGQRQLISLARALVSRSRIILCDEATSSLDIEMDNKIQSIMATAFRGRTLLCIAHRLRTVIGYDRVCVLDAGKVVELDSPAMLWYRGGMFRSMCDQAGIYIEGIQSAQKNFQVGRGQALQATKYRCRE